MALTQQQFQELRKRGLSTDQIIKFSNGVNPTNDARDVMVEKNKSPIKKVGSFLGTVGNALTSSEQTLGSGLSIVGFDKKGNLGTSGIAQQQADQAAQNTSNVSQLLKVYHSSSDPIQKQHIANALKSMGTDVTATDINKGFGLSNKQVAGATLGTILDVASAGTYGEAAKGAETGKLLVKGGGAVENLAIKAGLSTSQKVAAPIVEQIGKKAVGQTLKEIGVKTAQRSAVGAATGYGYDVSQNLQQDKSLEDSFKPGFGTGLGAGVPLAIGAIQAGAAITKDLAPRLINSLVKPRQADFAYGKNPGRAVSEMGITGNNIDDFGKNVTSAKQDIGRQIGSIYSSPANSTIQINASNEVKKIDQAIENAAKGGKNNQGIVTALQNIKDSLLFEHTVNADGEIVKASVKPIDLSKLTPPEVFDLKQKIANATKFTGNPSDDKLVNSTLKRIYGGLKDILNKAVGKNNPEIINLNEKFADLTSAEIAISHRAEILQRADVVSKAVKTGTAVAAGITAAVVSGGTVIPIILAGAASGAVEKALESTAVKTRVAAWLAKESPGVVGKFMSENPQIKTVLLRALPKFASKINQE
jgi:hypothetical protein